jgi:hypothetical protein
MISIWSNAGIPGSHRQHIVKTLCAGDMLERLNWSSNESTLKTTEGATKNEEIRDNIGNTRHWTKTKQNTKTQHNTQ